MKIICETCGKERERTPSRIKRAKHHYCSPECHNKAHGGKAIMLCENCGKEIKRSPSKIKCHKHHYCNNKCYWQSGISEETRHKMSKAQLGIKHSNETRRKLSKTHQGMKHNAKTKQKLSKIHQGMKHSAKTKQKLSELQRGDKHYNFGKHLSRQTKQKISEALTGKHISLKTRRKLSKALSKYVANGGLTYPGNAKPGHYKGIYMRAQWEIKVAQWLDRVGIAWQYEVRIPLGIHNYLPDFYLPQYGIFWEVKGYFREKDRKKMARVRALYPESKFVIIDQAMLQFMGIETGR